MTGDRKTHNEDIRMKVTGADFFITIGNDTYRAMIRPDGTSKGGVILNPAAPRPCICLLSADRCHVIDFLTEKGADRQKLETLFPRLIHDG